MNQKTLICLISILAIGFTGKWDLKYNFFDEYDYPCWNDDLKHWKISKDIDEPISDCDGDKIVGGFGKFGKDLVFETYCPLSLPYHNQVKIEFDMYAVDSWEDISIPIINYEYKDKVILYVDGQSEYEFFKSIATKEQWEHKCGRSGIFIFKLPTFKEYVQRVEVIIDHCDDDISLSFLSSFDQSTKNESWGINDIKIYVNDPYHCEDGYYWDNTYQSCQPCFLNCAKCSSWHICDECKNSDERVLPTCWCKWGTFTNKVGEEPGENGECYKPDCDFKGGERLKRFSNKNEYDCVPAHCY